MEAWKYEKIKDGGGKMGRKTCTDELEDFISRATILFKFRPSSHSDDFTIIASYKDDSSAEKVKVALEKLIEYMKENPDALDTDWSPDEACISSCGNEVSFSVYSAGYLDSVESVLQTAATPTDISTYTYYQYLRICVRVPRGLTHDTMTVVLDKEEAEAIRWLLSNCGEPQIGECGDEEEWKWEYKGDGIYNDESILNVGFEFDIASRKNWQVEKIV